MRTGRGKSAGAALFKPKNEKNYVNARARKSPKENGANTLEGGGLNP